MLNRAEIQNILSCFELTFQNVTKLHDTSRAENDERFNYALDDRYVLKVNTAGFMREERLRKIGRLIGRYRSIGVYCPALIPTKHGTLSCDLEKDGKKYSCYAEEFAVYPVSEDGDGPDRREVVEHLGILAAKYTGVDLSETRSMWSIIDLAPLDTEIDEKQENADALVDALREIGCAELADRVDTINDELRREILTVFERLPRCVYQGDLNSSNILQRDGHFAGLIDFNLSGTDVNINVFLNETNCFPEEEEFDRMCVEQVLEKMETGQKDLLDVIFRHYTLNEAEKFAFPLYKKIVEMFQYPNVCSMIKWLKEDARRDKCIALIRAMAQKAFC